MSPPGTQTSSIAAEVELWVIDLTAVPIDVDLVAPEEQALAARFATAALRDTYLARVAATRTILGRYVGVDPRRLDIDRRCLRCGHPWHGKPRLAGDASALEFNASSSGDLCLLAVSERVAIGVDVERVRDDADPSSFTGIGIEWQRTGDVRADRVAAFRAWVRHEAVLKGIGVGLGGELTPQERLDVSRWSCLDLDPAPGYVAGVATAGAIVVRWRREPP